MKRIPQACVNLIFAIALTCLTIYRPFYDASEGVSKDGADTAADNQVFSREEWLQSHTKVRGILVTGPTAGTERLDDLIRLVNETELNAVVLDVKDDYGNITFNMDNEMVTKTNACIPYVPDIREFIKKLKKNNIYVIARLACFKDPVLAENYPELALKTHSGEPVIDGYGNPWVNPCKEQVWDYLISIAESCADLGFDEIQLDYVRFPVGSNAEDAYFSEPVNDENRQQYIISFMDKMVEALHEKNTAVTADVFGIIIESEPDAKHIGQDYVAIASKLDGICPMIYPSHYSSGAFGLDVPDAAPYEVVNASLKDSKKLLADIPENECAVVRPWLQAFTASNIKGHIDYDGEAIRKEIQGVYDAGYEEWILWSSRSEYSAEGLLPK